MRRDQKVDHVEAARRDYANSDIPLSEMERWIDVALDPQVQRLRTVVEDVKGVVPETSATIAAEFITVEALENASPDDFEELYGSGPNTARSIHQRINSEPQNAPTTETADTEISTDPNS